MKKKTIGAFMICLGLVLSAALATATVSADGGPKPRICPDPLCWEV